MEGVLSKPPIKLIIKHENKEKFRKLTNVYKKYSIISTEQFSIFSLILISATKF